MKSPCYAAVILSACLCAVATFGQEQPGPPRPPPATPAPPAPGGFSDGAAVERARAKVDKDRAKVEMERAMAGTKAQVARGTFVKVFGKTEPASYLGVSTSPANAALAEQLKLPRGIGLVVDYVEPKSPAEEAQIKPYD